MAVSGYLSNTCAYPCCSGSRHTTNESQTLFHHSPPLSEIHTLLFSDAFYVNFNRLFPFKKQRKSRLFSDSHHYNRVTLTNIPYFANMPAKHIPADYQPHGEKIAAIKAEQKRHPIQNFADYSQFQR